MDQNMFLVRGDFHYFFQKKITERGDTEQTTTVWELQIARR
jgi:hypothetical protein